MSEFRQVPEQDIRQQYQYMAYFAGKNAQFAATYGHAPGALVHTFGCQQNEADSERLAGMLREMGYTIVTDAKEAEIIVINTCAVREHAENRALGNIGALAHWKKQREGRLIALCGCMVQQEQVTEKIKKSYPQVDLVLGTHQLWRFPELVYQKLDSGKRVFDISGDTRGAIAEGLPVQREDKTKGWLSIMYGCNNFCTYCIVPYVKGRERSRQPEEILREMREMVDAGYKDITLLGQNVNSYGKDLGLDIDFADLLKMLNDVPGDFRIRFMTSHPKDASKKLFDTMAACEKVANQLHLPFQSGSNAILSRMNRRYTNEAYRALIAYAREKMPDITLSSDVIVGFPGETEEDFQQTLALVQEIGFDQLFTFLYSKRTGTPAAEYPDETTQAEKKDRFQRLLAAQDAIVEKRQSAYRGKRLRVLIDGPSRGTEYPFTSRTEGGLMVCCAGEGLQIGEFAMVEIVETSLRCLFGRALTGE